MQLRRKARYRRVISSSRKKKQSRKNVIPGECLIPLFFYLFLNDIEEKFLKSSMEGLNVNMFKMFLLLYADVIIIFANTAEEKQNSLNL